MYSRYGQNMSELAVVLPNTRSAFYLKNEFKSLSKGKNAVLPSMFSMDEWVSYLAEDLVISELEARLILFESFKRKKNPEEKPETFFALGQVLLQDFEEIVRNQKPLALIYRELSKWEETGASFSDYLDEDQKRILERFWAQFDAAEISEAKERFISLWKSLPAVFEDFVQSLKKQKMLTSAMAYDRAAGCVPDSGRLQKIEKVFFAGFGHLSVSEIRMMETLSEAGKAEIFWDVEESWMEKKQLEYSRLFAGLSKSKILEESIRQSVRGKGQPAVQPETDIIFTGGLAGMAAAVRQLSQDKGPETALFVTDPAFVGALLQAGYEGEFPYNISLGYPVTFTTPYQWMSRIFSISEDDEQFRKVQLSESVQHPFFLSLFSDTQIVVPDCLKGNSRAVKIWLRDFSGWWKTLGFENISNPEWACAASLLAGVLLELEKLVSDFPSHEWSYQSLFQYFTSISKQKSLSIQGSAENGIQVMGMFEGRILDFEEVMIAPAGDGNLPGGAGTNTFLTENIRRAFGLPLLAHRSDDEVYRFYRFFHRSRKITLFLDQSPDSKPGRIVQQLRYGLNFKANVMQQTHAGLRKMSQSISFSKNDDFREKLLQYSTQDGAKKSFSTSSLFDLFSCQLRFYFSRFKGLEAATEASAIEMDPRDFGTWVHGCVQELYRLVQTPGSWLREQDYYTMKQKWSEVENEVWVKMTKAAAGKQLDDFIIEKEIGRTMAFRFFDFMALHGEEHRWLLNEYVFPSGLIEAAGQSWRIGGRADIILETKDEIWIIDLKTGNFEVESRYRVPPADPEKLEKSILNRKEVFQMLLYAWLGTAANLKQGKTVKSMLFHMANPQATLIDSIPDGADRDEIFNAMKDIISAQIEAFHDPEKPVMQAEDRNKCLFCDFNVICQR